MTSWEEKKCVVCPFYNGEEKNRLRCESVIEGATLHIVFPTPLDKAKHRNKVCSNNTESKKCPIFKMLCDKYYNE